MQYQIVVNIVLFITIIKITLVFAWYSMGSSSVVPGENRYYGIHDGWEHKKKFTNEWTVQVEGGEQVAQLVALELGYVYKGPVSHSTLTFNKGIDINGKCATYCEGQLTTTLFI